MRVLSFLSVAAIPLSTTFSSAIDATAVALSAEQSLNFLLLGDWGKGGNSGSIASNFDANFINNSTEDDDGKANSRVLKNNEATYQAAIAKAMGSYSDKFQPAFVVALGDNFYTNGVSSSTDVYWDYLWTNVYLDYYAALRIPWYPVLGNHDWGYGSKGIQAQIDRSLIDDHWSLPSTNYTKTFSIPTGGTVTIVFVDTTTLAPSVNKCCNQNGGISTDIQAARIQNQLAHIDAMLAAAVRNNPTWLLVAGHYPVFSMGEHGDTSELKTYLLPLLQKYKVHAYFCGHDHFSDHLKYDETHYFVAGGGSMTDVVGGSSSANGIWAGEGYSAFASASATKEELTISYIDSEASVRYSYTLNNPRMEGPSMHPTEYIPPVAARSVQVSSQVVALSSGFAALAFLLIAGGFYYESKGRKKKKKSKKGTSRFMSYSLPGTAFTTKSTKKVSKVKNSLRALASTRSPRNFEEAMMEKKNLSDGNEEGAERSLMHGQKSSSIVLGTSTSRDGPASFTSPSSKRFKGEVFGIGKMTGGNVEGNNTSVNEESALSGRRLSPTHLAPTWEDDPANGKTQQMPHTIISHLTSSTPIGVQRSKDGRIFEAIPDVANEHHKRARTSIF